MSAHPHDAAVAPFHATRRGYLIGFALSVLLTAVPFALVMGAGGGHSTALGLTVMGFAAVQMVVHMIYFLHMDPRAEGGWTVMALGFTVVVVVIALTGSLWVMAHLNANMMPGMSDMRNMP